MVLEKLSRKPIGDYYEVLFGKHPDYGDIYRRGHKGQIGSQLFVKIPASGVLKGGEYTICCRCKDPIIEELGQRTYAPMCDASAHYECVLREQLRYGPIRA
jgi:hypothetical protein